MEAPVQIRATIAAGRKIAHRTGQFPIRIIVLASSVIVPERFSCSAHFGKRNMDDGKSCGFHGDFKKRRTREVRSRNSTRLFFEKKHER